MIKHNNSEAAPPSRVVVLGGSGFVGQHLVRRLAELSIPSLALSSSDLDLAAPESVDALGGIAQEGDALVFLSTLTPDKGRDTGTLMRNLAMGQNVSAFLQGSACSHVVYVSSDAVYEDDANPIREESCCDPSSFHGLMHLVRERMLRHTLMNTGVPLLILRPSLLYGPGDTHNGYGPNRFFRTALESGKITLFGNGEEKRDHVYVCDLADLICRCLTRRSDGILNVATGESVSFNHVAKTIAGLNEGETEIECLPRRVPITHRHFHNVVTLKTFPDFKYTLVKAGLSRTMAAIASGSRADGSGENDVAA